ncbi:unnamed protein product, partial [Tetraodon nigroviridis]
VKQGRHGKVTGGGMSEEETLSRRRVAQLRRWSTETPAAERREPKMASHQPPTAPPNGTEYHLAYPRNYRFIIDNTDACKSRTPLLVLLVPVAPHNLEARQAIRQTWGNQSVVQGEEVHTLFMLGITEGDGAEQVQEEIKQENLKYGDLIQSNFLDSYINLTIKTMVIMDWLATRCPTAAYGMKVDSDMFLNIDNLVLMLKRPDIPKENYLTGMLMFDRPVVRSKDSKWYVPEELLSDSTYPPYTLGMGYIFSNDLPGKFVEISKSIKPFNIEDAYVGMCMKRLGLQLTSPPDPSQFKAYSTGYDRCEYSRIITYILGTSEELIRYWTDLKRPEPPC